MFTVICAELHHPLRRRGLRQDVRPKRNVRCLEGSDSPHDDARLMKVLVEAFPR
jgi:hypothetical protein